MRIVTAIALALLPTAVQAASDEIVISRKGAWTSSYYASNADGVPMCNTSTVWTLRGRAIASMHIKYTGEKIFIHLFKTGWKMPTGTEARASLKFEDRSFQESYSGTAVAGNNRQGMTYLEFTIGKEAATEFLHHFAEADKATLSFPDGDEPNWIANMSGSRDAAIAFQRCAAVVKETRPTQPTGRKPTQPSLPAQSHKPERGQI